MHRVFGNGYELTEIEDGDRVKVGGHRFNTETSTEVRADLEHFQPFFNEAKNSSSVYNKEKLKEWLERQHLEVDERIFASLFAFTKVFEKQFPKNPNGEGSRAQLYQEHGNETRLSEVFDAQTAACAEIAILAQYFLQQENVPSSYFSGDVLWQPDQEFSEEHSFIVIHDGKRTLLYDPTNPTDTTQGMYPSIYTTEVDFDETMAKKEKRFVTATNMLSKRKAFFGANNGTNIIPERHIV